jgi:hypothetical protein
MGLTTVLQLSSTGFLLKIQNNEASAGKGDYNSCEYVISRLWLFVSQKLAIKKAIRRLN